MVGIKPVDGVRALWEIASFQGVLGMLKTRKQESISKSCQAMCI